MRSADDVRHRLRAAFGPLYETLLVEAPERAAWAELSMQELERLMSRARERVGEPGHALGFRTLLKQELDAHCDLAPPPMTFEAPSLPLSRTVVMREARRDERARERERIAHDRREELRAQAIRLWHAHHDSESRRD